MKELNPDHPNSSRFIIAVFGADDQELEPRPAHDTADDTYYVQVSKIRLSGGVNNQIAELLERRRLLQAQLPAPDVGDAQEISIADAKALDDCPMHCDNNLVPTPEDDDADPDENAYTDAPAVISVWTVDCCNKKVCYQCYAQRAQWQRFPGTQDLKCPFCRQRFNFVEERYQKPKPEL